MLISSGPDWTNRTKRWAARAPGLEIFTQAFVLRDKSGWQITEAGRALLASIESRAEPLFYLSDLRLHYLRSSPRVRSIAGCVTAGETADASA
ncbi:hypothetical protein JQ597_35340 [Bradyrhizobium sp. AUGA SZCCT0177]|uniref:hypothetical protein n=1 Tax=Bradyrhizobium sp. AUGA SZCCT0177 TaxID=2807665 RepID=UPI001BA73609|nr:hypothetical protein [Bradyrhizobium sp. AUGA SZCCT0177]MBR1287341.1 hypothetical protein [Bradyrhizobium sp. AUGA SZCCT0177]